MRFAVLCVNAEQLDRIKRSHLAVRLEAGTPLIAHVPLRAGPTVAIRLEANGGGASLILAGSTRLSRTVRFSVSVRALRATAEFRAREVRFCRLQSQDAENAGQGVGWKPQFKLTHHPKPPLPQHPPRWVGDRFKRVCVRRFTPGISVLLPSRLDLFMAACNNKYGRRSGGEGLRNSGEALSAED
jgi:hypothetical protein